MDFPYYRYTLGATATYREASLLKQNLVKKGFDGAYVVPFVNAYRVDKTLAKLKMENYQDNDAANDIAVDGIWNVVGFGSNSHDYIAHMIMLRMSYKL